MALRTLDNPGEGFASVLMMTVSISPRRGFVGLSKVPPLDLTDCRMGRDHIPRPPPIACNLRFERVGMSLCACRHSLAGFGADGPHSFVPGRDGNRPGGRTLWLSSAQGPGGPVGTFGE